MPVLDPQNPFGLPEQPVDLQRVDWWTVESWRGHFSVEHHHAIYHVNRSWKEVYPEDAREGAAFVDHWQLFDAERFHGRNVGWPLHWEVRPGDRSFFLSRKEAVEAAVLMSTKRVATMKANLEAEERALAAFEQELATWGGEKC